MASKWRRSRSVRNSPGATELTRMPDGANSRARRRVSPPIAAFAAAYGTPVTGDGWRAPIEEHVTMVPPPAAAIRGAADRQQ